jgi:hypothetical protein
LLENGSEQRSGYRRMFSHGFPNLGFILSLRDPSKHVTVRKIINYS